MKIEADLVVFNGNVITMDSSNPTATAIAIKNFKFLLVGSDNDVIDLLQSAKRVIDLGGKTVVPGFVDAHTHITSAGLRRTQVNLSKTTSLQEVKAALEEVAREKAPGAWILGYGWDESKWAKREYPTAKDLDEVSTQHPIAIKRIDEHLTSANTLAIEKFGVPLDQEGVLKDRKGRPIGVFKDVPDLYRKIQPSQSEMKAAVISGARIATFHGITTVVDNTRPEFIRQIAECERDQSLTVRFIPNPPADTMKHMIGLGLTSGLGGPMFRIGGVKSFIDGSIGARTAALFEDYTDERGNKGKLFTEEKKFARFVKKAIDNGIQTVTHAIGDRAIELLLNAFESLDEKRLALVRTRRHRIEHAEMMNTEQIRRAVALGLILSMQPNFVGQWQGKGGLYEERLGEERTSWMNMFRVALDNGAHLCFGSDGMPYGPLYGIWSAVAHPNPRVKISVEEALRCYTMEGAYSVFMERNIGSITVGKRADFVVLSEDITKAKPEQIREIQVENTFVGGIEEFSQARNRGI
ncbi:MAG: amidohydrolase [Candidatus Thorarchaeota archaeon]|nr:amidohydrolase [Candidatus Thorarchaeota archaeon]